MARSLADDHEGSHEATASARPQLKLPRSRRIGDLLESQIKKAGDKPVALPTRFVQVTQHQISADVLLLVAGLPCANDKELRDQPAGNKYRREQIERGPSSRRTARIIAPLSWPHWLLG